MQRRVRACAAAGGFSRFRMQACTAGAAAAGDPADASAQLQAVGVAVDPPHVQKLETPPPKRARDGEDEEGEEPNAKGGKADAKACAGEQHLEAEAEAAANGTEDCSDEVLGLFKGVVRFVAAKRRELVLPRADAPLYEHPKRVGITMAAAWGNLTTQEKGRYISNAAKPREKSAEPRADVELLLGDGSQDPEKAFGRNEIRAKAKAKAKAKSLGKRT
eukprot:TRINITY_DN25414_c0_g2_i1.p1 TRINITY_DN25414_c0_g2~~TRINITY_DN25414_c0_g2_i1.p1  ORF type:complete len:218 (+),score=67.44 TRINITY_DN25414_c0_g2_i1:80-733(+)